MTNRPKPQPQTATPKKNWQWYRMDLHLHTPASADFKDKGITYLEFLQKAESRGLDIIALTDHNTVAGWAAMYREVETLLTLEKRGRLTEDEKHALAEYRRLADRIMVLPGFEVTATLGFHVLGIFPMGTSVRKLEHILLDLNIPEDKLELGVGEVGSTTDVLTVYREIAEAGGIVIAAHANSTHGVALQGFDFGGQTKIAYTQDRNLHALEVTDLESTSRRRTANFFNGSKPEYPRRMHCIQGSDAHRLDHDPRDKSEPWGIGDRVTEVYLPELTFDALKELFLSDDFGRIRPARPWGGPVQEPAFDEVKAARKQGPNLVQSFHEHFSTRPGRTAAIVADVVAMANTNGGTVYVGVNASPKPPVAGVEKPEEAVAILKNELQKATTPPIGATLDIVQSESKPVIVIKVPKGTDTPYVLGTGQIYVRQESETTLAMRDEIIRLVLASHAPGAAATVAAAEALEHAPGGALRAAPHPAVTPAVPVARPASRPMRPLPQPQVLRPAPMPVRPAMTYPRPAVTPAPVPTSTAAPAPATAATPAPVPAPAPTPQPEVVPAAAPAAAPTSTPPTMAGPAVVAQEAAPVAKPRRRVPAKRPKAAPEAPQPLVAEPSPVAAAAAPEEAAAAQGIPVVPVVTEAAPEAAAPPTPEAPVVPEPSAVEVPAKPRRRVRKATAEPTPVAEGPALPTVPEAPMTPEPAAAPVKSARRRTTRRKAAPAAEEAAAQEIQPEPVPAPAAFETMPVAEPAPAAPVAEGPALYAEPPRTGVEILDVENRDGVLTYTVRDLRNGSVVHNVTRFSARHLWKYAIAEREDNPVNEAEVSWLGNLGLWKTYKRAGAKRYNLVQRDTAGQLHVYYGVTEDGIHNDWRNFLENE